MDDTMFTEEIATVFDSELIGFLANRYRKSAPDIIRQFIIQNGNEDSTYTRNPLRDSGFTLENNEMEILKAYYNKRNVELPSLQ